MKICSNTSPLQWPKVSFFPANALISSPTADDQPWFMVIFGICPSDTAETSTLRSSHVIIHKALVVRSDWIVNVKSPRWCFDLEQKVSLVSYASQQPGSDLWVVYKSLRHKEEEKKKKTHTNQHINDCDTEGAEENINPQVHYINWNRPRRSRRRFQADWDWVVINERPVYEYSPGQ